MRVAVIGAGLAGLSAALHLRGDGHEVVVLEREAHPGGRCGRLERDGFTFDTGPTVFTRPQLLDDAFRAVARVERIEHDGEGVTGARLADGELVRADAVVCTLDLPVAYGSLLPRRRAPRAVRRARFSPSCVVWHLGVRGAPPADAAHHNIAFGAEWDEAFRDLLDRGVPMRDPSRFIAVPSLDDPSAAPEGCSALYVLEPAPNLLVGRVDWRREAPPLRDRMLADLERRGYPADIVAEELVTPEDWRRQGMAAGTPFAVSHAFSHTGPFRPANRDPRVPSLFFAGSSTTPGVGIPMVLVSGRLAAARVREMAR